MNRPTIWFDFDGTIVFVKERFYKVHIKLCEHFRIKPLSENDYWNARCNGISTREILQKINGENFYEEYISKRNVLIESLEFLKYDTLRENAVNVLKNLRNNYTINLLTGRIHKENLFEQLNWLGIKDYFNKIHVVSAFGGWEDKFEVLKKYSSKDDIMVGDNPRDIIAGKKAQIKTIAILNGMSTAAILESNSPDYIIDEFSAIAKILEG